MGALYIYSSDGGVIEIPKDRQSITADSLDHAFFIGSEGTLGLTETDSQPVEKTYSNGVVFPDRMRRTGRDFTIDILFTDLGNTLITENDLLYSYGLLEAAVSDEEVYIDTGLSSFNAQCQRIDFITNELHRRKKVAVVRMFFKGQVY